MYVKKIEYYNFRNIDRAKIEPSERVTLLYGKNAEGKTNALEGIYLFAHGRSFRASKEKELVKFGSDFARVKLTFDDRRRENTLAKPDYDRTARCIGEKHGCRTDNHLIGGGWYGSHFGF